MEPFDVGMDNVFAVSEEYKSPFPFRERLERVFVLVPAQTFVAQWISSFKDFPPRQKPANFSIDQIVETLQRAPGQ